MITKNPTEADLLYLAENMRNSDKEEIAAGCGLDPLECLRTSVKLSEECKIVFWKDKPLFIYGLARMGQDGCIWLLGTDDIERCPFGFMKICRAIMNDLRTRYERMFNFVYANNRRAIKWLKELGAEVDENIVKHGVKQGDFRFFVFK